MRDIIKRILIKLFPELDAGYHLPMLAKVVDISDAPISGGVVDRYRPRYAVDVQPVNADLTVDNTKPRYDALPLPGQPWQSLPEVGDIVEIAFANGNPSTPFIRGLTGLGQYMDNLAPHQQRWQHRSGAHQTADTAGNWQRQTSGGITELSSDRLVTASTVTYQFNDLSGQTEANHQWAIGGTYQVEALGALRLTAGEQAMLASIGHLQLGTEGAFTTRAKQDATIRTDTALKVLAAQLNKQTAPKNWIGSDSLNLFQAVVDLTDIVMTMNNDLASHNHGGPPPANASAFNGHKSSAETLKGNVADITE